jgi:hypothetical protein
MRDEGGCGFFVHKVSIGCLKGGEMRAKGGYWKRENRMLTRSEQGGREVREGGYERGHKD